MKNKLINKLMINNELIDVFISHISNGFGVNFIILLEDDIHFNNIFCTL
jgi:hypothetical protein